MNMWSFVLVVIPLTNALAKPPHLLKMPYVTYEEKHKTYTGYLPGDAKGTSRMFYMLTEAATQPETRPLILFLSGGPGDSSVAAMFAGIGPNFVASDSKHLYQNPNGWNHKANILAIDAPTGVGFSYSTGHPDDHPEMSDDVIVNQTYAALLHFFKNEHSAYKDRPFYISGLSYAGAYLPKLAKTVLEGIKRKEFPDIKLQGVIVLSGVLDRDIWIRSQVLYSVSHGRVAHEDWSYVKENCLNGTIDPEKANFAQYFDKMELSTLLTLQDSECSRKISTMLPLIMFAPNPDDILAPLRQPQHNTASRCYDFANDIALLILAQESWSGLKQEELMEEGSLKELCARANDYPQLFLWHDTSEYALKMPCWNVMALFNLLNNRELWPTLGIEKAFAESNSTFYTPININVFKTHRNQHSPMSDVKEILTTGSKMRILYVNGELDPGTPFLSTAEMSRNVSNTLNMKELKDHIEIKHREMVSGHLTRYETQDNKQNVLDVVTVKGAGHFLFDDRPGFVLQVITNFLLSDNTYTNYSDEKNVDNVTARLQSPKCPICPIQIDGYEPSSDTCERQAETPNAA